MGPENKQEMVDTLDENYSKAVIKDNLDCIEDIDESEKELLLLNIYEKKQEVKQYISYMDWRLIPKREFVTMPSAWWEDSTPWNMLPDTEGIDMVLDELIDWVCEMGNMYNAWKLKNTQQKMGQKYEQQLQENQYHSDMEEMR